MITRRYRGDAYTQNDGSTFAPSSTYSYAADGFVSSIQSPYGTSSVTYDAMGRALTSTDADNVRLSTNVYNPDGSLQSTTPQGWTQQRSYAYDADGNPVSVSDGSTGYTNKSWYDGEDRLVEHQEPAQPFSGYAWMSQTSNPLLKRYLYDLSLGQGYNLGNGYYIGHGNLMATSVYANSLSSTPWQYDEELAYDGLDRTTADYHPSESSCSTPSYQAGPFLCTSLADFTTASYNNSTGRLDSISLPASSSRVQESFAYNALGQVTAKQFNDNGVTPAQTFSYDADGRLAAATTAAISGTESYSYNQDGNLTAKVEASGVGANTFVYSYYPSGMRSQLALSGTLIPNNTGMQYSYRNDGLLENKTLRFNGSNQPISYSYSNSGRLLSALTNKSANIGSVQSYDSSGRLSAIITNSSSNTQFSDEYQAFSPDAFPTQLAQTFGTAVQLGLNNGPQALAYNVGLNYGLRRQFISVNYFNSVTDLQHGNSVPSMPNQTIVDQAGFDNSDPSTQWSFLNNDVLYRNKSTSTYNQSNGINSISGTATIQSEYFCDFGTSCRAVNPCNNNQATCSVPYSRTNSYDALGRLTQANFSNWGAAKANVPICAQGTTNYAPALSNVYGTASLYTTWGVNGHPAITGVVPSGNHERLHWDGDDLLFTDNGTSIDDMKDGSEGDWSSPQNGTNNFLFFVRDWSGGITAVLNGGTGALSSRWPSATFGQWCGSSAALTQSPIQVPFAGVITDGWTMFSGSSTYEPQSTTWDSNGPPTTASSSHGCHGLLACVGQDLGHIANGIVNAPLNAAKLAGELGLSYNVSFAVGSDGSSVPVSANELSAPVIPNMSALVAAANLSPDQMASADTWADSVINTINQNSDSDQVAQEGPIIEAADALSESMKDILSPNNVTVGTNTNPNINTVSPSEYNSLLQRLKIGAEGPKTYPNYPGEYYTRPSDKTSFGVRQSRSGSTIDIFNSNGLFDPGFKIHFK